MQRLQVFHRGCDCNSLENAEVWREKDGESSKGPDWIPSMDVVDGQVDK